MRPKLLEAIKEAEVCHMATIKEADVCHTVTIKEAEVHNHHAQLSSKRLRYATQPIKEAKVYCTTTACVLQQTHRENVLMLECMGAKVEEGWDCQAFMEASGSGLMSLSTQNPWGNDVPSTTPDW